MKGRAFVFLRSGSLLRAASVAALLGLSACGGAAMPAPAPSPLVQQPMPDFKRRTLDGAEIDTKALRGKVVVVKFFAKYCEPCKRTLPAAVELANDNPDVAFVGIAEDEQQTDAREMVATYKLPFPVVHDAGNVIAGRYRVTEMPVTFVIDGQGKVRWVGGAGQAESDLASAIAASK